MLVLANGVVVPHVNPGSKSNVEQVVQRALYAFNRQWMKHKLDTILIDCWAKGHSAYDTINICSVNGYALCVAEPRRRVVWDIWDKDWAEYCTADEPMQDLF